MRRLALIAGLFLAFGVLLPASAMPAVGGSLVPLTGTQSGSCTTDWNIPLTQCVTTGTVGHFGLSSFEETITGADPVGPNTYAWTSTWTLTAASGAQVFGTAAGTITFAGDQVHATQVGLYTSSGGTGRLADATVNFTATTHVTVLEFNWVTLLSTQYSEGTIVGTLSH